MHANFIKIALRYLWRNKTYSILNFICLTFGLACAIVSVLYIFNAVSYDRFQKNYKRLYSVEAYVTYFNGDRFPKSFLSASLADVLKSQAPEIETITRVARGDADFVNAGKSFTESGYYADNNFFSVFTFPLVESNEKVLADPDAIAISENMAIKFFGNVNCVGKTLQLKDGDQQQAFRVTAVFRKIPGQSTLQFDFVIPFGRFLADNPWALETGSSANETWIVLRQNADYKKLEAKIKNLIIKQETTLNQELMLFPLSDKLLYRYAGGQRIWGEMQTVVIVGAIGFAILLIACFNFINLSIALNIRRNREAGIKKVFGSGKPAIVMQFLGETLIVTLVSLVSACILVSMIVDGFNSMYNNDIHFNILNVNMLLFMAMVILFTVLAAGLLPAFYLASSNPIHVLKGKLPTSHSYSKFRQGLIIFQLVIPVVLIICMMIIKAQDFYMRSYDVGVEQDKVIVLDNTEGIQKHAGAFKQELLANTGISVVSFNNCIPATGFGPTGDVSWDGKAVTEKQMFWCINSDFDYNKIVKLEMVEGRFFDPAFAMDSNNYVVNDVAAQLMKYKTPLGRSLTLEGRKGNIIGVFKNFHVLDLSGPVVPVIIRLQPVNSPYIMVKFTSGSFLSTAGKISSVAKKYDPATIFQPRLFREIMSVSRLSLPSNLVGLAFIIAIMLACMGLFGLASFTAESRTREIGIRKTNGAGILSIMRLLLVNYSKWVTVAIILAMPLAYVIGTKFLARFYFHTPMPVWAFMAGPAIAYVIAISTVSWQSWKAASRNPVDAIRSE